MITEFALAAGMVYSYNYLTSDKYKIKKIFNKVMEDNNLEYKIVNIENSEYGHKLIISLNGKGFDKLKSTKDLLETSLGHYIFIKQNSNLKTATIDVITETLTDTTKFVPVKLESPCEVYVGLNYKFEKLITSLAKFPHMLVSGQTGSGKTEIIRLMLTNSMYNFSDRDLHIYYSDLSDTCDFNCFMRCKQTKGYARTIEESLKLFEYMLHIYSKRLEIFSNNDCKDIIEYNEKYKGKRMNYIFLVLDEFADYYPTNKFEKNYQEKIKCYNLLKHLVRKSRKCGIFLCIGIQRPDTSVLDPSLRSGLCTKIGLSQNTDSSSLVVADNTELTNIENRKGLFMYGNKREWFKSLYINDTIIKEYVKTSYTNDRNDFNKFLKREEKIVSLQEVKNVSNAPALNESKSKTKIKIK